MQYEALRKQIEHLNERLIILRQDAQADFDRLRELEEGKRIAIFVDSDTERVDNLTIGSEIDMFRIVVSGYASQIVGWARIVKDGEAALRRLSDYRLFDRLYVSEWYLTDAQDYLALKRYTEQVDYLRLLLIQYINLSQAD